jgi:hypothetical protein
MVVYPMKICPGILAAFCLDEEPPDLTWAPPTEAAATPVLSASPVLHGRATKGKMRCSPALPLSDGSQVSDTTKNVITEDIGIIAFASSKRRPPHSIEHTQRYLNSWFHADTIRNS